MNSCRSKQYRELLVAVLMGALLSAFALRANGQGNLIFENTSGTRITNALTLQPAHVGMAVGLYLSLDTDAPDSALTLGTQTNLYAPGRFNQNLVRLSNVPEYSFIRAQVRAWSEQYGTYEQAVASGDPSVLAGVSNPFIIFASGGTVPTFSTAPLFGPFLVTSVPEPKAVILATVFFLVFLLFRRRRDRGLLVAVLMGALLSALALRANGQGYLVFENTAATRITNALTLQPAHVGMAVGLYVSLDINAPDSALMLATQTNLFAPGRFSQKNLVILTNVPEYRFIRAQVRAWSERSETYEQAVATGDPNVLAGVSNPFIISSSGGTLPVENTAQFMQPFLVTSVPEPKPVILAVAFFLMFLLFRRRRRRDARTGDRRSGFRVHVKPCIR